MQVDRRGRSPKILPRFWFFLVITCPLSLIGWVKASQARIADWWKPMAPRSPGHGPRTEPRRGLGRTAGWWRSVAINRELRLGARARIGESAAVGASLLPLKFCIDRPADPSQGVDERAALDRNHSVILPISGTRLRFITAGTHFMGAVSAASIPRGALAAKSFTSRSRPASLSWWRHGCSIPPPAAEWNWVRRGSRCRRWLNCISC